IYCLFKFVLLHSTIFAQMLQFNTELSSVVRVVNGNGPCSGRVEIIHSGEWGTVCGEHWNLANAEVVCKQLRCGTAVSASGNACFGGGNGTIWRDYKCKGNESSITSCAAGKLSSRSCSHSEDGGVVCSNYFIPLVSSVVRVVNGNGPCSGRVEIIHSGEWGTVCGEHWNLANAEVVCKQLRCGTAVSASGNACFGGGNGTIWRDYKCKGNESSITSCAAGKLSSRSCSHSEDGGVVCSNSALIRLAGGPDRCAGRLEVNLYGKWGTVCDDYWHLENAEVVCRQLDCGSAVGASAEACFKQGRGPIWRDYNCQGSEKFITNCTIERHGARICDHSEDVGVVCSGKYLSHYTITDNNIHGTL
uniref:SRCR domain-containing protein n=1 Tax=Denticeps clupeoides TaxID=299321 RepID=A0AAY4C2L3_9TELE